MGCHIELNEVNYNNGKNTKTCDGETQNVQRQAICLAERSQIQTRRREGESNTPKSWLERPNREGSGCALPPSAMHIVHSQEVNNVESNV